MEDKNVFEYDGLLVRYSPNSGTYRIFDIAYEMLLGTFIVEDGPGWVFLPLASFLDSGNLGALSSLVNDLNSELSA